jgi:crossover junction endodeoxyribonuclease RusA
MTPTPVAFTVAGTPAPGGSKTAYRLPTGRTVVVDACKRNGAWKGAVAAAAAGAMTGREAFLGPLELRVELYLPRPKAHYRKDGIRPDAPRWHDVRPDATKLLRAIEDAMTGIVWVDDSQVVRQLVEKRYADTGPRVDVTVREVDP